MDNINTDGPCDNEDSDLSESESKDKQFNVVFNIIDNDGNGTLSKDEMVEFIKRLTGLW